MTCTDAFHDLPFPTGVDRTVAVYEFRQAACASCDTPCQHVWAKMSYETDDGDELATGCVLCGARHVADERPRQGCRDGCYIARCGCCGKTGHEGEWLEPVRLDYPDHAHVCADCSDHLTFRWVAGGWSRSSRGYNRGSRVANRVCAEAAQAAREAVSRG